MLDRWLSSKNVNQEFKHLRQLVLIEQFKNCIHAQIKTHLDERDIDNLQDAATTADDYALTHKLSSISTSGPNKCKKKQNKTKHKTKHTNTKQNKTTTTTMMKKDIFDMNYLPSRYSQVICSCFYCHSNKMNILIHRFEPQNPSEMWF